MPKEKNKPSSVATRTVKPKKTLGLTIRPALQLPLPHDELIKPLESIEQYKESRNDPQVITSNVITDQLNDHSDQLNEKFSAKTAYTPIKTIPVQNLDQSNLDQSKNYTGTKIIPVSKKSLSEIKAGYLKLPNEILDNVLPKLSPTEAVVFLRLYRLSVGFNTDTCIVGITSLLKACNISEQTCRTALRRLINLNLIEQLEVLNNKEIKGTTYKILTTIEFRPVQNLDRSTINTGTEFIPNKHDDDHDDYLNKDHHQTAASNISDHEKAVMMIYKEITGNLWSKADHTNYEKIKSVPIEKVEVALRLAYDRATNRPNSFAFFIKEILSSLNPKPQSRTTRKKAMARIVERVRNAFVGSNISPSEFVHKVKEACLRDDVAFDNDLFDEVMGKLL